MILNTRFWILLVIFQVAFGLAVFAVTRHYYLHDSKEASAVPATTGQATLSWPDQSAKADLEAFLSSSAGQAALKDPSAMSHIADEFFANRQYDQAAEMYQQVLALDSRNVNTYNSLGITLHYLGRSFEALEKLNEGIAIDPTYQRIWLTLGYVNNQVGNIEQARKALTTAVQMGADNEVGQSAAEMLENLP
jgi:tetratricopeptide (TPR) repeat protein